MPLFGRIEDKHCAELKLKDEQWFREKTGLLLDPYFSATKNCLDYKACTIEQAFINFWLNHFIG